MSAPRLDTMGRPVREYASAPACGAGHPKTITHGRFYSSPRGTRVWKCLTCQKAISARRRAEERASLATLRTPLS